MAVRTYTTIIDRETALKWRQMIVEANRKPTKTTIDRYATDMLAGRWLNTGVPIVRRASDNAIIDGGNRIEALIKATETDPDLRIEFTIAEGVPDDAFVVLDIGRSRTTRDAIVMASDGSSSGRCSAIVTWYWKYQNGNPLGSTGHAVVPTRQEFLETYLADPHGFETSALRGADAQRRRVGVLRVSGLFHYLLKTTDGIGPELCEDFYEKFLSGAGLEPNTHPILQLRQRFISRAFPRSDSRTKTYTGGEQLYLFFRAWRAYCQDEQLTLVLPKNPVTNENFPKLYIP